jgi:glucosamine kinase
MRVVLGVDGGGTKTRVLVADGRGETLGTSEGAASAVRPGAVEHSADVIAASVRDALAAAGTPEVRPAALCVGVAGVGRETEREQLQQALAERELADEVLVLPDAQVALDDAFGDGPGILLVSGTGSIAFGRGPTGAEGRVGGWGPVCGDEGSGAWIGRRALSVVTASVDGREPETALVGAVLTAAELNEPGDLVAWAASATPAQLATLAAVVVSTAAGGDLRANSILDLAAEELALHVRTLARQLFADERAACSVALAGGLLRAGSALRKRVEHRLKSSTPGAQIIAGDVRPERGAMRAALALIGGAETPEDTPGAPEADGAGDGAEASGDRAMTDHGAGGDDGSDASPTSDTSDTADDAREIESSGGTAASDESSPDEDDDTEPSGQAEQDAEESSEQEHAAERSGD